MSDSEIMVAGGALSAADVLRHVKLIEEVSQAVMKDGTHYGKIPGCGDKPALLKPGAEKLLLTFSLKTAHRVTQRDLGGGHREYEITTEVRSGNRVIAEGVGTCSTMESKYRYRRGSRKCPTCGKERTIIQTKGGRNPGGYWCVPDKGGCGGNFQPGDRAIEGQVVGNVDNPDLADVYNTVLKMAKKRSLVDAALTATASSDFFAQDLEELVVKDAEFEVREAAQEAKKAKAAPKAEAAPQKPVSAAKVAPAHDVEVLTPTAPASDVGAALDEIVNEEPAKKKEPTSHRGLTLAQWQALSEEERAAAGDISRKQCKAILDLAKAQGVADRNVVVETLRDDFKREFEEWGIVELWQLPSKIASFAIDTLRGA